MGDMVESMLLETTARNEKFRVEAVCTLKAAGLPAILNGGELEPTPTIRHLIKSSFSHTKNTSVDGIPRKTTAKAVKRPLAHVFFIPHTHAKRTAQTDLVVPSCQNF